MRFFQRRALLPFCRPEQVQTTAGSEDASKDPEDVSFATPVQGILTRIFELLQCAVVTLILLNWHVGFRNGDHRAIAGFFESYLHTFRRP